MAFMKTRNLAISLGTAYAAVMGAIVYTNWPPPPSSRSYTVAACERLLGQEHPEDVHRRWDEAAWQDAAVSFATLAGGITERTGRRSARIRTSLDEAAEAALRRDATTFANRRARALALCGRYVGRREGATPSSTSIHWENNMTAERDRPVFECRNCRLRHPALDEDEPLDVMADWPNTCPMCGGKDIGIVEPDEQTGEELRIVSEYFEAMELWSEEGV